MGHIVELDAIRGIAALVILVFHLDNRLLPQGWLGVDLFLLLSGFLITSIILKQKHSHHFLPKFYARRALRIWPIYYLALTVAFLLTGLRHHPVIPSLACYLSFTQNTPYYWSSTVPACPTHFVHTWSLAVEEQYFLIWPLFVVLLGREKLVPICCGAVALCTLSRAGGSHWTLLITRGDGLALGGLLALLFDHRDWLDKNRRRVNAGFCLLGAAAASVACMLWPTAAEQSSTVGSLWMLAVNLTFFCGLGLVIAHAGNFGLRPLRGRSLCALGRVSYGLYLYHSIVFVIVDRAVAVMGLSSSVWQSILKLCVSLSLASLSWHHLEQPILRLKDRIPYIEEGAPQHVAAEQSTAGGPWVTTPA